MSEFYVYDGDHRVGILDRYTSIQWLEHHADTGEVKMVLPATPEAMELLAEGRKIYNTDTATAARVAERQLTDNGKTPTLTVRCITGAATLDRRVVMGTVHVQDAETGMRALVEQNLRGLPLGLAEASGISVPLDTQISWGNVLDGEKKLAQLSGLGFGYAFDPRSGSESFFVRHPIDRTVGDGYNGYLGDDIANITDIRLTDGKTGCKNVAVVAGAGEGGDRKVVVVGSGEGDERRELYVDARDLGTSYQTATDTGEVDEDGNPIYEYTTTAYSDEEYSAMLTARGMEKLAECGVTFTLAAEAADGGAMTYGIDYGLGDILPIKLTKYGVLAAARVSGVKITYEATGRRVEPILADFKVESAAAALSLRR